MVGAHQQVVPGGMMGNRCPGQSLRQPPIAMRLNKRVSAR